MNKNKKLAIWTIGTVITLVVLSVISVRINMLPMLNENQTLYFSSTLAQVSATLFGLSIAAYTFLDSQLEKASEADDTLTDIITELKLGYHHLLIFGTGVTGVAIILCIFNIIIGPIDKTDGFVFNCILAASLVFSSASIASTLLFTYKVTDPNRIQKQSKKLIGEDVISQQKNENYFTEFIFEYNKLEKLVVEYITKQNDYINRNEPLSLYKGIDYLRNTGVITAGLSEELHYLRKLRNYLVHGDMMFVNKQTSENLKKIQVDLNAIFS